MIQFHTYGMLVSNLSSSAVLTRYVYDAYGRETVRIDGRGNATTNVYDVLGRLVRTAIGRSGTMMSETRSDAYGYNGRGEAWGLLS